MEQKNTNSYSSAKAISTKADNAPTGYASKKVLGAAVVGGARRAPEYQIENIKVKK